MNAKQPLDYNQRRIACAERIGWTNIEAHEEDYWTGTRPALPMEDDDQYRMALPDPENPACPGDALALVEWMRGKGWLMRIANDICEYHCSFSSGDMFNHKEIFASAPTFSAAVVLAFLAATAGERRK